MNTAENRMKLEQYTSKWILDEESAQAFTEAANNYLHTANYKLYKYKSVLSSTTQEYMWLRQDLENNTMTLSHPSAFNDPFDCQFGIANDSDGAFFLAAQNATDTSFRVGCLTESLSNRLMWSHYADKHRGVCIEYDFSDFFAAANGVLFAPVIYSGQRPQLSESIRNKITAGERLTHEDCAHLTSALLTKDSVWRYEYEWRIVKTASASDDSFYHFPMPPISAVYFGAAMEYSPEGRTAKEDLQELCKRIGIKTHSMRLDAIGYAVDSD